MSDSLGETRSETCVICRDGIRGVVVKAPCGDAYDIECLVDLFRAATVDESLFPPACCRQPFDLRLVRQYLNKELATLVDKKTIEFGTKNRVYCHRPFCSTFVGSGTTGASQLACPQCWAETCGCCKKAAHDVHERCTSDEDASLIALAEESGWKRCPERTQYREPQRRWGCWGREPLPRPQWPEPEGLRP